MAEARQYTCAGVVSGRIYVCGGWAGPQPVRSVERYDPSVGRWEIMPQMMVARWGAGAGVINKRLYVCGGLDESRQPLSSVECFGPKGIEVALMSPPGVQPAVPALPGTHCWQAVPSMSERRGWPAAAALGGVTSHPELVKYSESNVEPFSEAFCMSAAGVMSRGNPLTAASLVSRDRVWVEAGGLHVFGGSDGGQCLGTAERFDPVYGTWSPLPGMAERHEAPISMVALCLGTEVTGVNWVHGTTGDEQKDARGILDEVAAKDQSPGEMVGATLERADTTPWDRKFRDAMRVLIHGDGVAAGDGLVVKTEPEKWEIFKFRLQGALGEVAIHLHIQDSAMLFQGQDELQYIMTLVIQWTQDSKYKLRAEAMTHLEWMSILIKIHGWQGRHFSPNYFRASGGTLRETRLRASYLDNTTYMYTSQDSLTGKTSIVSLPYRAEL
ncbi:unnamed protein product [Polarella glacialis]|uniref:Uncharacterized protein n=1 Tax=Polarella glacialis TaxID=89957 RepID=A0A813LUU8_POLGL|nr:unnamed protein product [Polarella glacialis]